MLNKGHISFWTGILNLVAALGRLIFSPGLWASMVLLAIVLRAAVEYADGCTPVTLAVDGVSRSVRTRLSTVGEVLDDVGVETWDWDRVTPGRDAPVRAKMNIVVEHARPVTVVADGATRTVHTHSQAVSAILQEAGLDLKAGDRLWVNGQLASGGPDGGWGGLTGTTETGARSPDLDRPLGGQGVAARTGSSRGERLPSVSAPVSNIRIERATLVYLNDSGVEQSLRTTAHTLGQALLEANVLLYLGDRVYPDLSTQVATGLRVRIQRGVPVSVAADGRTVRTRTHRKQVQGVLAELGLSLVGQDFVHPPLDAEVREGQRIQVVRVRQETIVEAEQIPHETEWIPDSSLELDLRHIADPGANGSLRRRYRMVYHDGQEVERYLEDEWVAQEPRSRKIAYGTQIVVRTMETSDGDIEYWRRIRVFLTSYTEATCGKTPDHPWYGLTRLGWKMRHGIIAVDPRVIPLRSQLYVPGYGPGVAGDTGGMINGRHIDLGFDVDNFVMYYWWGYVYVRTPVPPPNQIRWILPDFPRER